MFLPKPLNLRIYSFKYPKILRTFLFIILLIVSFNLLAQDQNLPKGMTPQEQLIWDEYLRNYPSNRGIDPPAQIPRTPAEWEEAQGVIITWTSYTSNLREIVRYAKQYVKVYIVCSNATTVLNYLSQGGVTSENVECIVASFNSVWVRDYGPQSIYLNGTNELAFVDWVYNRPRPADDVIPSVVADYLGIPIYQMTDNPNRLVATGGNFMSDGFGKGFSSKLILNENSSLSETQVNSIVNSYMGINPYIKMDNLPYDDIHHIDMHIKLLDEETLLVGQYPAGVADGPQIEANLNYVLNNFLTPYGRPYRVFRIPMPPDESGYYPNTYSDYLTYTNSIILNGVVLVPIYGLPQDQEALDIYKQAMPGYEIVGINMRNVIPASGAIHCITKEIAAEDPIFIDHAPIRDDVDYSPSGFYVDATVSSTSGIQGCSLYWSTDTTLGFNQVAMSYNGDIFNATIPSQSLNTKVFYYISATNNNGKTIRKPLVAPKGLYVFDVGGTVVDQFTLSFTINGLGGVTVNGLPYSQQLEINEGSQVNIVANPSVGYHFVSWSGDLISTSLTESFTMSQDYSITCSFEINTYSLQYSAGANGYLTGETSQTVNHGSSGTTVTAVANPDYHFKKWSDGVTSNPRTDVNVSGNVSVTAQFEINTYTVSYTAAAGGTISGTNPQTVNHGANGTAVTAVPSTGYYFTGWSDGVTDNPRIDINVIQNISVTAQFAIYTYNLTYTAGVNGSLEGQTTQTVNHGTSGSAVTAVPNLGYHFVKWSDGKTDNPRTDNNVTGDITVTAEFEINIYTLSYTAGNNGILSGALIQQVIHGESGSEVNAIPNTGYHFTQWSDGSTINPRTDANVQDDISVSAAFALNYYTFSVSKVGNGSISMALGDYQFPHGKSISLFASPDLGYDFVKWTLGAAEFFSRNIDFNLTEDVTATAIFAETSAVQHLLTIEIDGNGTTMPPAGSYYYIDGSTVSITTDPSEHWHFKAWTGDFSSVNSTASVTLNTSKTVKAVFEIDKFTLNYLTDGNGTISGQSSQTIDYGSDGISVTAVPNTGYHFTQWSDGVTDNPRKDSNVTSNINVTAGFAINEYVITYNAGEGGSISGLSPQTVNHGSNGTTVSAVPNTGFHFTQWSDGNASNPRIDTNVTDNISVTAEFAKNTYTLTYIAGSGGSISGANPQTVEYGQSGTLVTAVPNEGYSFVKWSDNVITDSRTESNVTADIRVTAEFAINIYTIVATAGTGGTVSPQGEVSVEHGGSQLFTITPDAERHIVNVLVNGESVGETGSYTFENVTSNQTIEATFEINSYNLIISIEGRGVVNVNGTPYNEEVTAPYGTSINLIAIPEDGWKFESWSGSLVSTNSDESIVLNIDYSIAATFSILSSSNHYSLLDVQVFPNPFKEYIYIRNSDLMSRVLVYSTTGVVVFDTEINGNKSVSLNTQHLPRGVYFIKLISEHGLETGRKIIKE